MALMLQFALSFNQSLNKRNASGVTDIVLFRAELLDFWDLS